MISRQRDQLVGIVTLWLAEQAPIDGANDTRYEFFQGSYQDAYNVTIELYNDGLLASPEIDDYGTPDVSRVVPTARGIFEAIR